MELLSAINDATRPDAISEAYKAAEAACDPYWDQVRAAFSLNFIDEMHRTLRTAWLLECDEHFARGFRLGFQLAQELTPRPA